MERLKIFDTTLRDGEQSPGCSMRLEEKLRMAEQLDRLGVDVIEAGFPAASEDDFRAVHAIAQAHRRPVVAGLARACREDMEKALRALEPASHPRLHIFLASSDIHLKYKLRKSRQEALEQACEAIEWACSRIGEIEFSPEDATRTDRDFLCELVQAVIEAGAQIVNIPDTVGYTTPTEMHQIISLIRSRVKAIESVTISVHCHNDLGMAVANSLAAVEAGARQVECTVNGIGERAGNASLEEIVMALFVRRDALPFSTGIVTEEIYPSSRLLSEITGVDVQPHKAIVGRNAFAHEAGIHQDGVLKNALTYEIMTPASVGVPQNRLVLGKHSGRHALAHFYEGHGYSLSRYELDQVYKSFIRAADEKKSLTDEEILALLQEYKKEACA